MKKTTILALVMCFLCAGLFADHTRIGFISGVEFAERPDYDSIVERYHAGDGLIPGFYWEVIPHHLGYGMTCQLVFDRQDSTVAELPYQWYLDWIATWDFRFHPFRWSFLDPFVELGLGSAGKVEITDYDEYGVEPPSDRNPLHLSLFGQVGWGLGFRLGALNLGARMVYRFFNDPPPATQYEPYPLTDFHVDLFVGFRF